MGADPRFETGVVSEAPKAAGRKALLLPVSIALHAAALAVVVVVPLLVAEASPEPVRSVRAFLVEPALAPPPPPPPPAPVPARSSPVPRSTIPPDAAFTAPVETPAEIAPEEGLDAGDAGGQGGVEGGAPGGVVGGVVGGLPEASVPAAAPVRVGGIVKEPRKVRGGEIVYPKVARDARVQGTVIIEAVIGADGRVTDARVLRGIPVLDEPALDAVRQSVYTPTLLDGVPTPVVMTVTVTFRLKPSA